MVQEPLANGPGIIQLLTCSGGGTGVVVVGREGTGLDTLTPACARPGVGGGSRVVGERGSPRHVRSPLPDPGGGGVETAPL